MIGGGGGGAGTAAESAATWTAVVRLISSFRSFQEATLPAAKPSAHALNLAPIEAIAATSFVSACDGWLARIDTSTKLRNLIPPWLRLGTGPRRWNARVCCVDLPRFVPVASLCEKLAAHCP